MNKLLVDELASQATDDILGVPVLDRYKFAELILRRCVDPIDKEKDIEAQHFSAGYIAGQSDGIKETVKQCLFLCDQVDLVGADDCINKIQDHFGIQD